MQKNLLDQETSPYLLQHKDNPVHWMPWGDGALSRAKEEDKPILLSVGYAACHWCHVMAHESFENDEIAALMNEHFINIKVDREERPDIDAIYQSAINMLGEQGGWPLTVFLTPDGVPFWGGTYFPPTSKFGRPGFPSVLQQIAGVYRNERDKIDQNATAIDAALKELGKSGQGGNLSPDKIIEASNAALNIIDFNRGGTTGAPKFPQPTFFRFLWQCYVKNGDRRFFDAVVTTLNNICQGGIYDHLGGGFARYSVDEYWLVPHFEKMLYDNALLIELLADVWRIEKSPLFEARIRETVEWMLRDLQAGDDSGSALASAYDADSEGVEGKYYVWSAAEIDEALGDDAALFRSVYDVSGHGNWEGSNILNREVGDDEKTGPHLDLLKSCRETLLSIRSGRVPPLRDDKVLADWNGMAIAALVHAGTLLGEQSWITEAGSIFDFIIGNLGAGSRLHHTWCDGSARHPAVLDDYANMARAALMLNQATGDKKYLDLSKQWTDIVNDHYWDEKSGAYFLAADDTSDLIVRTKTIFDNATPSGNGVMLEVLARLYLITGDEKYSDRADALIHALAPDDPRALLNQPSLAIGYAILSEAYQVVIAAPSPDDEKARVLYNEVIRSSPPGTIFYWALPDDPLPDNHPAVGKAMIDGQAALYVCKGPVCGMPVTETDKIADAFA